MGRNHIRILLGTLFIGAGILFLLQSANIVNNAWNILWILVFIIGSGIFFFIYFTDLQQWWFLMPATALLGLAGTIFVDSYIPALSNLSGAFFLGAIGVSFWIIYLTNLEFWWAIIPGGVLFTLGTVTLVEDYLGGSTEEGVFFVGLALTFLLVALLAKPRDSFWWAYIPAGVLFVIGIFVIGPMQSILNYIWPVVLIAIGGIILIRNFRKR